MAGKIVAQLRSSTTSRHYHDKSATPIDLYYSVEHVDANESSLPRAYQV